MSKTKKKLAIRFYEWWTGERLVQKRSYAAARLNKNNANWTTWPTGANYEQRTSLAALRARARQASRDNGDLKHFLGLTRSNVVGPKGIQLECNARLASGDPNVRVNKRVEEAFWQWGFADTCSLSGKLDWVALQKLVVTRWACDGEYLVQMIPNADNAFGFTLKVWDVNWLDETYNEVLPSGNRVIMSVEFNADDRPVAYWLTTPSSEMMFVKDRRSPRSRQPVPADQMIHGFLVLDDETQARGVTWFHAALLNAKNYQGYEEGVIQSARMASNLFGFIKQNPSDGEPYTGEEDPETGLPSVPDVDVSPLSMNILNAGQSFEQFDPKQPTQQHSAFAKTVKMGLASALDVPYFYLAGDMEAVNFSSSRVGLDDARDIWKGLQDHLAATLCRPIFHAWLRSALLAGAITLTEREYREVQNPNWRGRRWAYIDPTKDIAADAARLQNRLTTPSMIVAERDGHDYEDVLRRWDQDRKLAAGFGIDIDAIYTEKAASAQPELDDDEDGKSKKAKGKGGEDDDEERELSAYELERSSPGGASIRVRKEYTNGHAKHVE